MTGSIIILKRKNNQEHIVRTANACSSIPSHENAS